MLILASGGLFVTLKYLNSPDRGTPLVYSNSALLLELWDSYKSSNIEQGSGRTLDRSEKNITTSEGQSYTMQRAVWMDDKVTFDKSWQFTQYNMQRKDDHLISWKFGQRTDGTYGILTEIGGQNTASDADTDIALSLMMAYTRWNQASYLFQAKQIINSIWEKEVVPVKGQPVLTADDLERYNPATVVVNPSYFSPYSYKLFARVDNKHDWMALSNNSYSLLTILTTSKLGSTGNSGLPPNWITINRTTGELIPTAAPNLDTNYGYDAFRIPWRLALDYNWNKDPRDAQILANFTALNTEWTQNKRIATVYAHDGTVVGDYESPAAYGTALSYFMLIHPDTAKQIYKLKLLPLYSPDLQKWKTQLKYYDDNWAWFGIALYDNALPNLALMNN